MLGYVKVEKPELKVREYEIYSGYYCGVCKSIGKRYGQLPRMVLSYDAAFLAIMLESLSETLESPTQEHCVAHPFIQKKTIIRNKAIDYAADVMLILAWYKMLDDANDEGKLYAKSAKVLLKGIFKKLRAAHPALCEKVEEHLGELCILEKEKCDSIDMAAEAFSKIMEVIFEEGIKFLYGDNFSESFELAKIGYHMGKWIYLIDAADDIEDNLKTGAYNPLIYRFSYKPEESIEEFRQRIKGDLEFNLYHYLAVIGNCLDSLDIKKNKGIIDNVIYFGLNRKTEEIINGPAAEKEK